MKDNNHELPPSNIFISSNIFGDILILKININTNNKLDLTENEYEKIYENLFLIDE